MTQVLTAAALLVTAAGVLSAIAAYTVSRWIGQALPVLLDFLTAAGLLRLAADVSWGSILVAAAVIAVRKVAALGIAVVPRRPGEDLSSTEL
ncbi:hypothetical protein GCM10019016_137470 [Streptomyces prasinosporus]|uniref:DUF1622 domain-containing protein n=1 Tax=Streptomyces prasinosporus TaxID=68256 RepID=A0ABP6UFT6_9ACTN|nr:hypothetical protein [Streptomyces sp. DH20]GHB81717.1 hypothetical protein GCM10010332_00410 [Streptomyces albogriseolus]